MESYQSAMEFVLKWEGGYADHPSDRGGRTFAGISEASHPDAWEDGKVTRAEVEAIYRANYWDRIRGDDLPTPLDLALFDYAVHSGPGRAVRELQALLSVARDGIVGPRTLRAISEYAHPDVLAIALVGVRAARLVRLAELRVSQRTFLFGWMRRLAALQSEL